MRNCCIILLLTLSLALRAQSPNLETRATSYLPVSPASAKLIQEINHPVNYGIGAMDLSIPLYTIKTRDFTLPITLRCNTSGIKCAEHSGWVALGWTLEAEPTVTREIKGRKDEEFYISYNSNFNSSDNTYLGYLVSGTYDEMPDIFYFKTLSNSGKFVFKRPTSSAESGKYVPLFFPATPEKVDTVYNNLSGGLKIRDEKGNSYYFGTDTLSIEKSYNSNPGNLGYANGITTWKVKKIVSPQNDSMTFAYQKFTKNIKDYSGSLHDYYAVEDMASSDTPPGAVPNSGYWKGVDGFMDYYANNMVTTYIGNYYWYNLVSYKYTSTPVSYCNSPSDVAVSALKTISYASGHVDFTSTDDTLMQMKIYEGSTLLQTIDFAYQNISIAYHGTGRLLNGITITDNVQSTSQTYSFTYYPNYASTNLDCWGYNNGTIQSNTDRVPMQTIKVWSPDNRYEVTDTIGGNWGATSPQLTYCLSNTINSITYPTELKEVFTYELHQYKVPDLPNNQTAGGLRIKSILSYEKDGTLSRSRQFTYGEAGEGRPLIYPFLRLFEQEYTKNYHSASGYQHYRRYRVYNSQPLKPLDRGFGSPVIYDKVTETDGAGGLTTKTVYTFNNSSYNYPADTTNNSDVKFPYDIPEVWLYNKPTTKEEYNTQTSKLLRKDYTTYGRYIVPGNVPFQPGEAFCSEVVEEMDTYNHLSDSEKTYERTLHNTTCFENYLPVHKDEVYWANGDSSSVSSTATNYTYGTTANDILTSQPIQSTVSTSDNSTVITKWKYPYHLSTTPAQAMVARNDLCMPLEMTVAKGADSVRTVNNYVSGTCGNLPYKLGSVQKSNTNTQALYDAEKYNRYDERGNLTEYVRKDGVTVTLLWGYDYQKVVAEIVGADYTTTMNALNSTSYPLIQTMTSATLQSLFQGLRARADFAGLVTSYTYFPTRGVATITDPRGVVTGYDYDGLGRLIDKYRIIGGVKETVESYQYHMALPN